MCRRKIAFSGKWAVIDATVAMENMVIAAWALGIGSCWIVACNEQKVKELLTIPDEWKVVALITLGYPLNNQRQGIRKQLRNC